MLREPWFGVSVAPPEHRISPVESVQRIADDVLRRSRKSGRSAGRVWSAPRNGELPRRPGPVPSITAQRARVLDRLMLGETNAEIAAALGLAKPTVKNHVALSLRVLGARNRVVAAVQWALRRQAEGKA